MDPGAAQARARGRTRKVINLDQSAAAKKRYTFQKFASLAAYPVALMKRHLLVFTVVAALAAPVCTLAQDKVFKAGAATSNITPPLGMTIVGNFAPQPVSKHVHDELHVRCLALADGRLFLRDDRELICVELMQ